MKILFTIVLLACSLVVVAQPTITSFTPASGNVGTSVTITGTNFSATAANNIVYFGATKGTVTSATTTSLVVTVPSGSTTRPITVTTAGLTAYSKGSFIVTYPGGVALTAAAFTNTSVDFNLASGPRFLAVADFDLDGKPDAAAFSTNAPALSVLRNTTTTPGNVSFATKIDFTSGASGWGILASGDLDGDGKLDVVTANYTSNNVSVFLNTSPSAGTISFGAKQDIATATGNNGVAIHDLNADGKPDIIAVAYNDPGKELIVLKNTTTTVGTFTYTATTYNISGVGGGYAVSVDDFDGDGKPDVAIDNEFSEVIHVLRNTSSAGTITFAAKVDLPTLVDPESIQTGDITGDGKPEIIVDNYNAGGTRSISIFKNLSSGAGNISFDTRLDLSNGTTGSYQTYLHDMDGDAKLDVVAGNYILRNTGSAGSLSLSAPIAINSGNAHASQYPVDIDNNGKPDLLGVNFGGALLSVFRNINNDPTIASFSPTTGAIGTTITLTGTNFTGATAVSFGGTAASSFTVVNATTITAVVASGTSGNVSVTTPGGTAIKSGFTFDNSPSITSFTPTTAGTGTVVNITGVRFTGATAVTFGGTAASSFTVNSATSITATVAAGASGSVAVTTSFGTGTKTGFTFSNAPSITDFTPGTGGTGSVITITGLRFTGATAVTFGGVAASSFTVNSATSITATVAAGASGSIAVTTPAGTGSVPGFVFSNGPSILSFAPVKAAQGEAVVITGLRFTGATAVSFGGVSAQSFTVNSDTQITAIVGGGGTGGVQVNTPAGADVKAGFTLNTVPDITSFSPTSAGQGATVTITGLRLNYVSVVKFGGIAAASFVVNSPTEIKAVVAAGASGDVFVSNLSGTESDTQPGFTFIPPPTVTSFAPTTAPIGGTVVITGTNFTGATSVKIGTSTMTTFTVDSPTQITLKVSDSPTTGTITVTTPAGTGSKTGFTLAPGPKIDSFTPASGPVGTVITITGTNFDPVAANNKVYFGSVAATVSEASATTLKVAVPTGSSYAPLMVMSGKLVAYALRPFNVTFEGGGVAFTASTFSEPVRFPANLTGFTPALGDLNSDGKPDVVIPKSGGASIFLNSTVNGDLIFDAPISVDLAGQQSLVAVADFDADGKQDLAIVGTTIKVLRNTSTGNTLSFDSPVDLTIGASTLVTGDFDGDGRIDIAVGTSSDVRILRNVSLPGVVAFRSFVQVIPGTSSAHLAISDVDQDGKLDLVSTDNPNGKVRILKNTSTPTNISFVNVNLSSDVNPVRSFVADLDSNLRPEITTFYSSVQNASIFFNGGDPGTIAFSPSPTSNISLGQGPMGSDVVDIDGDAKSDLIAFGFSPTLGLFRNLTAPDGNYSFEGFNKTGTNTFTNILVADFDGNGKPDIFGTTATDIFVLRNQVGAPYITTFTPKKAGTGSVVTITGDRLTGVTGVTFGGVPATSFTAVSATSVTAVVPNGATGAIGVTTDKGIATAKGFVFFNGVLVNSVVPSSGSVGASITINGAQFSTTASDNIVRFGATKAVITSATETQLVVKVPAGATYGPITVTKGNIVASSPKSFIPTFGGTGQVLATSFTKADLTAETSSRGLATGDFDDDGKTDLVITNAASNAVSVFQNTSTTGTAAFGNKTKFDTGTTPEGVAVGDIDGDGKLDIVVANSASNSVSVLRNTSSGTTISFAAKVDVTTFTNPQSLVLVDLDGDGKLDIATASYHGSGNNSILRNTSTVGSISFAPKVDIVSDGFSSSIASIDLNTDGLPDLVIANSNNSSISRFINRSSSGNLVFALKSNYPVGSAPIGLASGEFFGSDDLPDLLVVNSGSVMVLALHTDGSFTTNVTSNLTGSLQPGIITDLGGDATPDFLLPSSASKVTWMRGSTLFTTTDFTVGDGAKGVIASDFDGDGATDFATVNETSGTVSIMQNKQTAINSFSPTTGTTGTVVTINGANLSSTTGVLFGGTAASSFTIVNPNTITAVVSTGTTGNVVVVNASGNVFLPGFTYTTPPSSITSFTPTTAAAGETVTITGVNLTGTKSVSFGGVPAQSFNVVNATTITAVVGSGATGSITIVSATDQTVEKSGFTFSTVTGIEPDITTGRYAVALYPNPSNGREIHFQLNEYWIGHQVATEVIDMTGRRVHAASLSSQPENKLVFEQSLNRGVYLFSVMLDGKRIVKKIMIE